jgi:hypothetical protein
MRSWKEFGRRRLVISLEIIRKLSEKVTASVV